MAGAIAELTDLDVEAAFDDVTLALDELAQRGLINV
jgi:hypothetical protein